MYCLAIDIGASSGRHILGEYKNGNIEMTEIYRFENGFTEKDGFLSWDTEYLTKSVVEGIKKCSEIGKIPQTVAIDTWGVDYVLLDKDEKEILPAVSYRDPRNVGIPEKVEKIISLSELYKITGIPKQNYNTIYQLFCDKESGKLDKAEHLLMMPEYLSYPVIFSSINHMSEAAEKREVETQNKLLVAQIEAETAQLAADSQSRHDRRHHNFIMLGLVRNGDYESLKEYLESLVDDDNKVWGETRYCENTTINMILTMYKRRAKENGISVKISAKASNNLAVPPQDLVIVIANLFENAINATAKLNGKGKNIDIQIKDNPERLLIKIDNPCRANLSFDEMLYGIGIRSVITTTTKYEGMYDFTAEDGVFSAKIILNLR